MFYNYVNMYFISYNYKKKLYKNSITWICCHFNDDKNINQNKRMNRYSLIAIQLFGEFVNGI